MRIKVINKTKGNTLLRGEKVVKTYIDIIGSILKEDSSNITQEEMENLQVEYCEWLENRGYVFGGSIKIETDQDEEDKN